MSGRSALILIAWLMALGAFFGLARPGPPAALTYRADGTVEGWVAAVVGDRPPAERAGVGVAPPGAQPALRLGRLPDGAAVVGTRLVVGVWDGSPATALAGSESPAAWYEAVRSGQVRLAVPGPESPLGKDFAELARRISPNATTDFYRGADRLRDRDDLYFEDFRNLGPARWDAGILYESAALQINRQRADQGIRPLLRLAYLDGASEISYLADSDPSGDRLIAWLVSPAGQARALDFGLRPFDPSATSPDSLFQRFAPLGARSPR